MKKNYLKIKLLVIAIILIVTQNLSAQCNGGKIYTSTLLCSSNTATLKLKNHTTTSGTTYQWQFSNGGPFVNVSISRGGTADTFNINPFITGLIYKCKVTCAAGVAYSDTFFMDYAARTITMDKVLCSTTAGGNDSVWLKLTRNFPFIDTNSAKNFTWEISSSQGLIWSKISGTVDSIKVKFTSAPLLYRAVTSLCPAVLPYPPAQISNEFNLGLKPLELKITNKDCTNDTATFSIIGIEQSILSKIKINWYSSSKYLPETMRPTHDTFLKAKVDSGIRYYRASLKLCETPFPSVDFAYTKTYVVWPKVGLLKATIACPSEVVSIDYDNRDSSRLSVFTLWKRDTGISVSNPSTLFTIPVDSVLYRTKLINKQYLNYKVYSKFCDNSVNILDSTNMETTFLNISPGQLIATSYACPNDSIKLQLNNYVSSSSFPLFKRWEIKTYDALGYSDYTENPLTDASIVFRLKKGLTYYKKSTTLCDDKYATRFSSTLASTYLPYRAIIDTVNCGSTSTVKVLEDTIKIVDVTQTITKAGPFTYQWYSSSNKVNYTAITGGTGRFLTIAPGTTNLFYKRISRQCVSSTSEDTTNPSNVFVPSPTSLNGKATILSSSCLNDTATIGITNFTNYHPQTPTYLWQRSDDEIVWYNIESLSSNDSTIKVLVGPGYQYFRRLTFWCPSGIVDSSTSTPLVYNQPLPWCESFDYMIQFGSNALFNCWRYDAPVCSSYIPIYAASRSASPIFSRSGSGRTGHVMQHQPPPPAPPVTKTADGKLITPAFYLKKGKIYRFSFWHKENTTNLCWDSIYVTWGKTPNACDITNKFGDNLVKFSHDQWSKFWADFVPKDTGIYYFAINYRDKDATKGDIQFDDVCLKEVDSCQAQNPLRGATFAPSKIIQRPDDPGSTYDKNKVTHQYCLHDTIMLTYNPSNYNTNFDFYGMTYQFYKLRNDVDWKINDTFFRPVPQANPLATPPEWECHVRNRTDYHVMNVLVTDTDTYYKIVATCLFDGKQYSSDSLRVNGTHSLPYCEDWESVGQLSNKPKSDLPSAKNSDPILGAVPSFASCPTCWASYPQPPTPNPLNMEPFFSATLPWRNTPTTSVPQLAPDNGFFGDDVVINGQVAAPYLRRKLLVFPAVRLYKGRGYRVSFRWTDNRINAGSPYGNVPQDFDSLYLVVAKGNQSGKTIDSFPKSKMIGLLKKDLKANILEQGIAKYQTFWVDYQPVDTGTYFFSIVGVAGAGTSNLNTNPYRFYMDYFCIDTLPIDDCSEKPRFTDPLRIRISPDAKTWPWLPYPGPQWCVGNDVNIELDFGLNVTNEWKYGYKMIWERTTDDVVWTKFADSTNGISYRLTYKYQNFRLRLVNACGQDTIIGPFNVLPPGGDLCWTENFDSQFGLPSCWDIYTDPRVGVKNVVNRFGHSARSGTNYLLHDYALPANQAAVLPSLTHVPPGFGLKPGTYRFSFWYKDNGISQRYDTLKVGWSYIRNTIATTNKMINTVNGDFVKNSRENKWRYYSAELVAPTDSAYHIKVTDFNIGNKLVYYHLFDDYMMKEKALHDMLVIAVDSPFRQCGLNANTTVLAKVMNLGYSSESNVPVRVKVDNLPVVTVTLPGPIGPNEVQNIIIPGVDLSQPGARIVKVWTDLVTDTIGCKDDTFTTEIFHKELFDKPIDTGDTFCKCFPVNYIVNTPNYQANWYLTDTSTFPFQRNDTIKLSQLCRDTFFYVSANNGYSSETSPFNYSFGRVTYFNATNGIVFDNIILDTVLLRSVDVYTNKVGTGTIRLRQYGTIINTFTAVFNAVGKQKIIIGTDGKGWKIPPGTDYELEYVPGATNVQLASVATFSFFGFGIPGIIEINRPINTATPPNPTIGTSTGLNYLYFFNMAFDIPVCESKKVKVNLRVKEAPVFQLTDTARVCKVPTFLLYGPNAPTGDVYTYSWSNPHQIANYKIKQAVNETGWYKLSVTNLGGCTSVDSSEIILDPSPEFNLGNDTSFCNKSSHLLDSKLDPLQNAIVWSNGTSGSSILIQNPGTYICTAYNIVNFCSAEDTIIVTRKELPIINAGNDRVFCGNLANLGELLNPLFTYQWFKYPNIPITLPVTSSGKYYVVGTDTSTKCSNIDTLVANLVANPILDLGSDIDHCGSSVTIPKTSISGNYNYVWSTTSTKNSILVSLPGKYFLTITDPVNNCKTVDSINVKFKQVPVFDLGPDISLCARTYNLSAPAPYTSGVSYLWTGINVKNPTSNPLVVDTSGTYTLRIDNGCYNYSDQINVTLKKLADQSIDMLPDTAVGCKQVQLTATKSMTGNSVQWNITTSDNKNNSIVVNKSGSYSVSLTNECGVATKSVLVRIDNPPVASFDIVYPNCMSIGLSNTSIYGSTYLWDFGDGNTSTDFSPLYQYTKEGEYIVTLKVTNSCGTASITKKIIKRYKDCKSSIVSNLQDVELILYPNPTKDKATLLGNGLQNDNYHISVRNLMGQLVTIFDVKVINNTLKADIDFSKFSNGEYLIEIYTDKESIVKKLEVIK